MSEMSEIFIIYLLYLDYYLFLGLFRLDPSIYSTPNFFCFFKPPVSLISNLNFLNCLLDTCLG